MEEFLWKCLQWASIANDLDRMMEAAQNNPEMPEDVSAFVSCWKDISKTGRSPNLVDFAIGLKLRLDQIRLAARETGIGSWPREKWSSETSDGQDTDGTDSSSSRCLEIRIFSLEEIDRCVVIANKLDKMMARAQEILRMPKNIQAFVTTWREIRSSNWSPNICDFLIGLKLRLEQIQLADENNGKKEPVIRKSGKNSWLREKWGKLKACLCCCCRTSAD